MDQNTFPNRTKTTAIPIESSPSRSAFSTQVFHERPTNTRRSSINSSVSSAATFVTAFENTDLSDDSPDIQENSLPNTVSLSISNQEITSKSLRTISTASMVSESEEREIKLKLMDCSTENNDSQLQSQQPLKQPPSVTEVRDAKQASQTAYIPDSSEPTEQYLKATIDSDGTSKAPRPYLETRDSNRRNKSVPDRSTFYAQTVKSTMEAISPTNAQALIHLDRPVSDSQANNNRERVVTPDQDNMDSATQIRQAKENLETMDPPCEDENEEIAHAEQELSQRDPPLTSDIIEEQSSKQAEHGQATISELSQAYNSNDRASSTSVQAPSISTSQQAAQRVNARIQANTEQPQIVEMRSRPGQMAADFLSTPVLFSYNQPHQMTNCWLKTCGRPTSSADGRTVICPRCGEHSYVRYCNVSHFITDLRNHYIGHCGRRQNLLLIDESTVSPRQALLRPFVHVTNQDHDSMERHRQALYHSYPPETNTNRTPADYYVFSDADRFDAAGLPTTVANLSIFRGTGSVAGRVRYDETDPRKALFAQVLERLLVLGVSAGTVNPQGCRLLFLWIKANLIGRNEWTEIMITRVCLAMQLEFGWRVAVELRE